LLFGFFLVTNILTAFMTSKAAIAILLPIAISIAHAKGLPVPAFILIVAYGGAASFSTPIGYQTNLMVYGPGGYTFSDYFRIGFPLTLIYGLVATTVLIWLYGL
jgi:di/tricarboxylate transporter